MKLCRQFVNRRQKAGWKVCLLNLSRACYSKNLCYFIFNHTRNYSASGPKKQRPPQKIPGMAGSGLSIASSDENQLRSLADLKTLIEQHAKYKERSYQTSKERHVPLLNDHPTGLHVVLFGDSMLERMKTTGGSPDLQPWPSTTMLSSSAVERISGSQQESGLGRIDGVFNAGVGGDRIENMLYRLLGDPNEKLTGLIPIFNERDVRLWIVQAGTNNLHRKHGLRDNDHDLLRLLLQTLLKISHGAIILLTELFYRKDIPDELVDKANEKRRSLIATMNTNIGREAIVSLPAPMEFSKDRHLYDHVHLNLEGYQIWAEVLVPKAASMLGKVEISED